MKQPMEEIKKLEEIVLNGNLITKKDSSYISRISNSEIFSLFVSANKIRNHFKGNRVEL